MKIKDKEITVSEALDYANYTNLLLYRRDNDMLLSDYQVTVLKNNNIDYNKYDDIRQLLFDVEELLNNEYDEELDIVSGQLAELIYYNDTKK